MNNDQIVTAHVTRMLDQSIDSLEPEVCDELARMRQQALQSRCRLPQPLLIAASLAAFVILPWMMLTTGQSTDTTAVNTAVNKRVAVSGLTDSEEASLMTDPDFLNNWEMLDAIGEELHGT